MPNLLILSRHHIKIFNSIPKLNPDERISYINNDIETRRYLRHKKQHRKVGYLLHKAYFMAKGRFFDLSTAPKRDINFAVKRLNLDAEYCFDNEQYTSKTQNQDKDRILAEFGWSAYEPEFESELLDVAKEHAARRIDSEKALYSLLDYCWAKKVTIPPYETLAKIVTNSIRDYQLSVLSQWNNLTNLSINKTLSDLIHPSKALIPLSELKKIKEGESLEIVKRNSEILAHCRDQFLWIQPCLKSLNLKPEGIRHFADQINKNDLGQLRRKKDIDALSLNLACFIQDQFYQRQDHSILLFRKIIRGAINTAKAKDNKDRSKTAENNLDSNQQVVNAAKESRAVLKEIYKISTDEKKPFSQRNEQVVNLLDIFFESGNQGDIEKDFDLLDAQLLNLKRRKGYYYHLFEQHSSLIKKLSPIIKSLTFDKESSDSDLIEAIEYFKANDFKNTESLPLSFLKENDKAALQEESEISSISRWKILLFSNVLFGVRDKKLILKYSYKFRMDYSYLIPILEFERNFDYFLRKANLDKFKDGKKILNEIGRNLNKQYFHINDLANKNEIEGLQKRAFGWILKNLEADYDSSKYIPNLLNDDKSVTLYELLAEVDKYTSFSSQLKNSSQNKELTSAKTKRIYASLMSLGTNLGHHNMSKAAKNIPEKQLRDIEKQWLSPDSLSKANEAIVAFIKTLPLPKIFHNNSDQLYTSSDGKKIVVAVNSVLANFSYKYYGKEQGITANSFVDEEQAFFNVNVHSSSDREAASMLDGILQSTNTLYLQDEREHLHATDQHGFTDAIFSAMYFNNVSHAPRFAKIHEQKLWAFDSKTKEMMKKRTIKPTGIINRKLILKHWDKILHLMASIKLGYCSASHLFRMLSAQSPKSDLYKALQSFGQMLKSSYILRYLEKKELRRNVQKQLNRIENGQKLSGAVFFGRQGKLMVGSESDIQKAMMSKTILKNAIIAWNYLYLSDYCCQLSNEEQKAEVIESISRGSVIAWAHINMHGIYDFDRLRTKSFKSTISQMKALKI